jgi:hypothetical protein
MMKKIGLTLAAATLLTGLGTAHARSPYADEKIGTVKAFRRAVAIDLEACRKSYRTSGRVVGICRVNIETKEDFALPASETHLLVKLREDGKEMVRLDGHGTSYALEYDNLTEGGKTDWVTAEPIFREHLQSKLGGKLQFEVIVFKIE